MSVDERDQQTTTRKIGQTRDVTISTAIDAGSASARFLTRQEAAIARAEQAASDAGRDFDVAIREMKRAVKDWLEA